MSSQSVKFISVIDSLDVLWRLLWRQVAEHQLRDGGRAGGAVLNRAIYEAIASGVDDRSVDAAHQLLRRLVSTLLASFVVCVIQILWRSHTRIFSDIA